MLKPLNPPTIAPPFSRYSQGMEAAANCRWLHVSGQVGVTPDGKLADGFARQAEQAWRNVLAVLEAAGMTAQDLVKVNVYLTRPEDVPASRTIRDAVLRGAAPASTLVIVAGLAQPGWLIEVEAVAAKA